jgi:hypothetical protein
MPSPEDTQDMKAIAREVAQVKGEMGKLESQISKLSEIFQQFILAEQKRADFESRHKEERIRDGQRFERLESVAIDTKETLYKWLNRGFGVWFLITAALGGGGAYMSSAVNKLIEIETRLQRLEIRAGIDRTSIIKEPFTQPATPPFPDIPDTIRTMKP